MQAKLSRQEEKQALAELKAHKVALASMERRVAAALARKDTFALAWLSVLRESFAHGTALEVRERNLQTIYTALYKLDPKAPIPACCLRSAEDLEEEERSVTVRSASSELNKLVSQLQVEYHELTAPLVAMKPNVYFLCTCHLGRPMEMGRIYVDKQSTLPPIGDVPWVLVCMWALLIGSAVNSVVQRMGAAGKGQPSAAVAAASARPAAAKGPGGAVPAAAMTTFKAAPGGIREVDAARREAEAGAAAAAAAAAAGGQGAREASDWWDDLDEAVSAGASRFSALERHPGQQQEPDPQDQGVLRVVETAEVDEEASGDRASRVAASLASDTIHNIQAKKKVTDPGLVKHFRSIDGKEEDENEGDVDGILDAQVEEAGANAEVRTPEARLAVEQLGNEEVCPPEARLAVEQPGNAEAAVAAEARGQHLAAGSTPVAPLVAEQAGDAEAEVALERERSEGPLQAMQHRPLLRKDVPEDWIARLARDRKSAIAVASAWSPGPSLLQRRKMISRISLVAVESALMQALNLSLRDRQMIPCIGVVARQIIPSIGVIGEGH